MATHLSQVGVVLHHQAEDEGGLRLGVGRVQSQGKSKLG